MLQITGLTYRIAGRTLLDNAEATIAAGTRVGLVGPNGAGKSTLLKLIAGSLDADGGDIRIVAGMRLGQVAQEVRGGSTPLIDIVLEADTERAALLDEEETAEPERLAEIHARLFEIGAHAAPARAAAILAGLGFDEAAQQRPASDFSGGWRMRVALAAVLFAAPDLLLLDEPTNHLDLEATVWLTAYLASYPGTLILVSHDRALLNAVPQVILHLDQAKLTAYRGDYENFEEQRRARAAQLVAAKSRQEAERAHLQAFVDRFRAKASKARQAQSRVKRLAKMQPLPDIVERAAIRFDFPPPEAMAPPILTLDHASVGYGEHVVLKQLGLRLDPDDRVALLGANGNGKSTLIKLIAGDLKPMAGEAHRPGKLRVGFFAQHQAETLPLELTPLEAGQSAMPKLPPTQVRAQLARFGLGVERVGTKIGKLSGGEKARLLLALATRDAPHLLLLDEPTNHLDIESRQALIEALAAFPGAVVLVSHDPHLVGLVADRLLLVEGGTVRPFEGDIDEYARHVSDQRRASRSGGKERGEAKPARASAANKPPSGLRKRAAEAERKLEALTAEKQALEAKLADPALYAKPGKVIAGLRTELAAIDVRVAEAEAEWLEAAQALEVA